MYNIYYSRHIYFLIFPIVCARGRPPSESNISIHDLKGLDYYHMIHLLLGSSPKGLVYHITVVMAISLYIRKCYGYVVEL